MPFPDLLSAPAVFAIGVDDREELAVDFTNRNHSELAVVVTIINKADDPTFENPRRIGEVETALSQVLIAFAPAKFEDHGPRYALLEHRMQKLQTFVCDPMLYLFEKKATAYRLG